MRVGPRTMEVCPDFSAAHDSAPVSEWLDQRLPPGRVPPQRRAETVVQNSIDSSMAFFFVLLPFRPGAKCLPVTRLSSMSCLSKFASWPLRHCKPASDIAIRIQEVGLAEAADPAENKHGRDCAAATHHNTTCQSSFSISSCLGLAASSKIADAVDVTSATPLFPPPRAPAYPRSSWLPQSRRRCRGVCHSFQAFWWLCRGCRSWQPSTARTALAKQMPWRFPYKRPAQLIFLRG